MKTILIYSGGMDSTVLLYHLLDVGYEVLPLSIDYGQKHAKELESAQTICHSLKLAHEIVDLTSLNPLLGGSSLTRSDIKVPEGHYASDIMKATIVPNRNMILLSVATGLYRLNLTAYLMRHIMETTQYTQTAERNLPPL